MYVIVEYSLSVDNLFVFLLIFKFFLMPRKAQLRVTSFGICSAMNLRSVMGQARSRWVKFL